MDTKQRPDELTGAAKAKDIQAAREPEVLTGKDTRASREHGVLKEPAKGEEKPAAGESEVLTASKATKGKDTQVSREPGNIKERLKGEEKPAA